MRVVGGWWERFTRGNTLLVVVPPPNLALVTPFLNLKSSTNNLAPFLVDVGDSSGAPSWSVRCNLSSWEIFARRPVVTLSPTLLVTVWYCGCGIVGRSVVLWVHISSGHTSTNQRFGHLPQNTIALPGYLGLVKIFSKCCFPSFWGAILIIADCNQDGRSPTPPLLATVHTKPHLCLMMYLSSFCSNSQADGKAGQTDRREVNFSDSPCPPTLTSPAQIVCTARHNLWNTVPSLLQIEKDYPPPLPPNWWL